MSAQLDTPAFLEFAAHLRSDINRELLRWSQFDDDCPALLREAIQYSLLAPGKRLRPALVLFAAEACGSDYETAFPAACAIEMVHSYSLIHDDLPAMDDDDLRRGQPTCHIKFGEATAVLAGDALLTRAFEVLVLGIKSAEIAAKCCAELASAAGASGMVGGQADDLDAEANGGDLEQLQRIHRRKTGALLRTSLRLGGMVSRAAEEQLVALDKYGQALGLAFQIVDDLLDVEGNEKSLGKRTGKDVGRGKITFPGLLGIDASRLRAKELIEDACQALSPLGAAAGHLETLARYVLERDH